MRGFRSPRSPRANGAVAMGLGLKRSPGKFARSGWNPAPPSAGCQNPAARSGRRHPRDSSHPPSRPRPRAGGRQCVNWNSFPPGIPCFAASGEFSSDGSLAAASLIAAMLGLWIVLSAHNVIARNRFSAHARENSAIQLRSAEAQRAGIAQTPDVGSGQARWLIWARILPMGRLMDDSGKECCPRRMALLDVLAGISEAESSRKSAAAVAGADPTVDRAWSTSNFTA